MTKPKVSVLMPVYNGERYLAKAIDSILAQSFADWELVLINDGSTDSSEAIIQGYDDSRIRYIKNEENLGLIKTLNKAIDYCSGEYIARMDADDIAQAHRLMSQVDFLDNNADYILCGTNAEVIGKDDKAVGRIKNFTKNEYLKIHLLFSVPFVHPSMMIRREILSANKYNEDYKHVEDYELWCRLSKLGKIANLSEYLLHYRWHDGNVSVLNSEYQAKLKDQVISEALLDLGIVATESELYCHKVSFQQYNLGREQNIPFDSYSQVEQWFLKLIEHNEDKRIYEQTDFVAYLWSRWLVLCLSQKQFGRMFKPQFASYNPKILFKLARLVIFLKQK